MLTKKCPISAFMEFSLQLGQGHGRLGHRQESKGATDPCKMTADSVLSESSTC